MKQACAEKTEKVRKARNDMEQIQKRYAAELRKMEETCCQLENELRAAKEALDASHRSEEQVRLPWI